MEELKKREGSQPPVAVVILNWNGATLLEQYLPILIEHTDPTLAEIIVADNGSNDHSVEVATSLQVATILLEKNYGFAEGYNRSIRSLTHPYIMLLNSDVRVEAGWLEPLYSFLHAHPDVVAVQPTIRDEKKPDHFEYAGAAGGYLDILGYPFCRGRIYDTVEEDRGQYGACPKEVFWTTGAAMLVRREVFLSAGGFDERYFAHQEEIDLCWHWHALGWKLYTVPESKVYHVGGASLSAENPHKTFLNFRNNLRMLYKLLPKRWLYFTLFGRACLDFVAALYFLLQGKARDAAAVCRAWYHFLKEPKVRPPQLNRKQAYSQLYPYMLLVRYHLYREHFYHQLKKKR